MSCRRVSAAVVVAAAAVLALSACQPRLGTAALVGDQRISDDQLQTLVHDALASPGVRDALPQSEYKGDLATYRRTVLNIEVEMALAESAARKLNISLPDSRVTERYRYYESQSGSPSQFNADVASKLALSPGLFRELVRREVLEAEIGYTAGGVHRPTDAELQRQFEQSADANTTATLTLVQLPDAGAARAALARVQQDPAALDAVAKQYASLQQGPTQPQQAVVSRLPQDLRAKLATLKSGDVFTYSLNATGTPQYYLIKFGGIKRPTLESSRPQLENQSIQNAAKAGRTYLSNYAKQVGVQINPRYGAWNADRFLIEDYTNPAVGPTAAPSQPSPSPSVPVQGGGTGSTGGTG